MTKKTQITIYVILGLIIAIGFAFIFYLGNNKVSESQIQKSGELEFDAEPVKLFAQKCLDDTGKKALIFIGKQGGYYELKKPYLKDENLSLPYYVFEGIDFSPSIDAIEKEISKYIDNELNLCLKDFEDFKKQGFGINYTELKSKTTVGHDSINIDFNFSLKIQHGSSIENLNHLNTIVDLPLREVYFVARNITNQQILSLNSVCLSCLYDLAEERNMYIDVIKHTDTSLIFEIMDYNITEGLIIRKPYNFSFAVKLPDVSCQNFLGLDDDYFIQKCAEDIVANSSQEINIEDIPNLTAKVGETFNYKIKALGNRLTFSDYSELFDITNDGIISFTPSMLDIGNHTIWINIKDVLGNEKFKSFDIEVVE